VHPDCAAAEATISAATAAARRMLPLQDMAESSVWIARKKRETFSWAGWRLRARSWLLALIGMCVCVLGDRVSLIFIGVVSVGEGGISWECW
jgi:hypothetical protein